MIYCPLLVAGRRKGMIMNGRNFGNGGAMIQFSCGCGKTFEVDDQYALRSSRCKECGATIVIPAAPAAAAPAPEPFDFAPESEPAKRAVKSMQTCRVCSSVMYADNPVCHVCGTDQRVSPPTVTSQNEPNFGLPWFFLIFHVKSWARVVAGIGVGVLIIAGIIFFHKPLSTTPTGPNPVMPPSRTTAAPDTIHPVAASVPLFPDRSFGQHLVRDNAELVELRISGSGPGLPMNVCLCLPSGPHAPGSLPCVFIASARMRLITGSNGVPDMIRDNEFVPYVGEGSAVLFYELSGPESGEMKTSIKSFMAADGGLVNVRHAVEFVLTKILEVDRTRLFVAGHGTAGTMALNAAASDHRFRAVLAFAPVCDAETFQPGILEFAQRLVPTVKEFTERISPLRHVKEIICPVILYHAAGDERIVPYSDNEKFALAMASVGHSVQLKHAADSYGNSIEVRAGIRFLLSQGVPGTQQGTVILDVGNADLGAEETVGGYGYRPPAGFAGNAQRRADSGAETARVWRQVGPGEAFFSISILPRTGQAGYPAVNQNRQRFLGAKTDYVVIAGIHFMRVQTTDKNDFVYTGFDANNQVWIAGHATDRATYAVLEAAARTVHK